MRYRGGSKSKNMERTTRHVEYVQARADFISNQKVVKAQIP